MANTNQPTAAFSSSTAAQLVDFPSYRHCCPHLLFSPPGSCLSKPCAENGSETRFTAGCYPLTSQQGDEITYGLLVEDIPEPMDPKGASDYSDLTRARGWFYFEDAVEAQFDMI